MNLLIEIEFDISTHSSQVQFSRPHTGSSPPNGGGLVREMGPLNLQGNRPGEVGPPRH